MTERVLIASSNPWSFSMVAERDLARSYPGAEVDVLNLFKLCSRGSPHWRRRDKLIETLNHKIERFVVPAVNGSEITSSIRIPGSIPPMPESYEALRAYELEGAKIGLAVLSTVTSLTTIQYPLDLDEYGAVLAPAWRSAHRSFQIGKTVRALGYDRIITFNGRHCYSRPFCDVLEQDSEVVRYEQGSAGNRYIAAAGAVQNPACLKALIEGHPFDPAAGEAFFRDRLDRNPKNEVGFMTATQRVGALPTGMTEGRTVTFFTSSSDENHAITDNALYGSLGLQNDIALALARTCRKLGRQLLVRLHPHLRFKHPAWKREWQFDELADLGAVVLAPEDPADSYAILRASQSVVTTGSTIGMEATYLGIPNAEVGDWIAGRLGASTVTNSAEELSEFITHPTLPPNARERALLFGSFYRTAGKLLPELDVGIHPHFARIDGRIVDPIRASLQRLRFLLRPPPADPSALDIRSGLQEGRVILAPGTDYSAALRKERQGKAATSGSTKSRRAATEKSFSRE